MICGENVYDLRTSLSGAPLCDFNATPRKWRENRQYRLLVAGGMKRFSFPDRNGACIRKNTTFWNRYDYR